MGKLVLKTCQGGDFVDEFGKPWFIETSFYVKITLNSRYENQSNIYLIIHKNFKVEMEQHFNGGVAKGQNDLQNEVVKLQTKLLSQQKTIDELKSAMDLMSAKFEKENDLVKMELVRGFLHKKATKLEFDNLEKENEAIKEEMLAERRNNKMHFENMKKEKEAIKEEFQSVVGFLNLQVDFLKVNKIYVNKKIKVNKI